MEKSKIRKQILAKRLGYVASQDEQAKLEEYFCQNLKLNTYDSIAGYWPINGEVNILPFLRKLRVTNNVCLPKTSSGQLKLSFHPFTESELKEGPYGIMEPTNTKICLPDILLAPCVAATATGERLGYGGGYYDYTLRQLRQAGHKFLAVGIVYKFQVLTELPVGNHDEKLDLIVAL